MVFKLEPTDETRKIWQHDFEYRFDVTLRADCIEWDVSVMNKGDKPFDVTLGMHTYFDVSSLKNVKIVGPFEGAKTTDKVTGAQGVAPSNEIIVDQAMDMLYSDVTGPVSIIDTGKGTKITMERRGFPDTVIWSPYGNEAMGFDKFVCLEPVQASPLTIEKEAKFYQKVSCEKI